MLGNSWAEQVFGGDPEDVGVVYTHLFAEDSEVATMGDAEELIVQVSVDCRTQVFGLAPVGPTIVQAGSHVDIVSPVTMVSFGGEVQGFCIG